MDMKIAGSGMIGAGEYDNVGISGSGKLRGLIKCKNLVISGAASGESIEASEKITVSGSASFSENVKAGEIKVSGSCKFEGNTFVDSLIKCAGSIRFNKTVKCGIIEIFGASSVGEGIEAEKVYINGKIDCDGLINAEEISIKVSNASSRIASIGGSNLKIRKEQSTDLCARLPILKWFYKVCGKVEILNEAECDIIDIENVSAPKIVGRIVKIGDDCDIDLVQYSESVEVSPKAKVGKTEKI